MRYTLAGAMLLAMTSSVTFAAGESTLSDTQAITAEIEAHGRAYDDLRELTDIGSRLAGSPNAERAVAWAKAKMQAYGFDRITLQPTTVPHWTRGAVERATLTDQSGSVDLKVTALGGSVGSGTGGVEAAVVEVQSLEEVAHLGAAVRGKIVFYNRPMDPTARDPFDAYERVYDQRSDGPSQAARFGAVAVLVRTLTTLADDDHPHTGMLSYRSDVPKIPAAAISTHGANELSRRLGENPALKVRLELSAEMHGTVPSYNVIGEITGSEKPDEIVVVGGHLDSWDLSPGAHDDGAGVVQSLEVVRALKELGLKPKRTIRTVLFMAEEFGGYGARDYALAAKRSGQKHIAAIESDRGGFAPVGFSTDVGGDALQRLSAFAHYLEPLGAAEIRAGGSGTDVAPLQSTGAVTIGYVPEARHYFDYHHSALDQFSVMNKDELTGGAAAMAVLAYGIAQDGI